MNIDTEKRLKGFVDIIFENVKILYMRTSVCVSVSQSIISTVYVYVYVCVCVCVCHLPLTKEAVNVFAPELNWNWTLFAYNKRTCIL